jgi:uncharacterized membrane protein
VLILPPDHQRQTQPLRRLSARERWLVRIMAALTALIVIAVVVSIASSGQASGNGCVHAIFPGPVGAEQVNQCGAAARSTCATLSRSGYGPEAVRTITVECRKAGLPVTG